MPTQVGSQDIDMTGYWRCNFFTVAILYLVISIFIVSGVKLLVVELPTVADGADN